MKLYATFVVVAALSVAGCATETERYQWSLAHARICPRARGLPRRDFEQIARVVAHATPQPIFSIGAPKGYDPRRKLMITTAFPGAYENSYADRNQFGWCTVEKIGDTWQVTERHTDLEPVMVWGGACIDE